MSCAFHGFYKSITCSVLSAGPLGRSKLSILKILCVYIYMVRASLVAQLVKNPNARQETSVQFLSWEDPLEMG